MTKDSFGVWEIKVPPKSTGEPAIPHDSKLKVKLCSKLTLCVSKFILSILDFHGSSENASSAYLLGLNELLRTCLYLPYMMPGFGILLHLRNTCSRTNAPQNHIVQRFTKHMSEFRLRKEGWVLTKSLREIS